ncbi:MAG: hypothetical protein ACRYFX_04865 [Janthinobacterium lividum]
MLHAYPLAEFPSSTSFLAPTPTPSFATPKLLAVKRIDFPLRPHLLKYLQVSLELIIVGDGQLRYDEYVLSTTDRFGFALSFLLRKPVKSARHEGSAEDCTEQLGVNLRNFPYPYYDLTQGKLSPWVVFQFNEFVEESFRRDMYHWVRQQVERRATIKDGILSCMAYYHMSEQDVAYETLRKDVQRNGGLPTLRAKKNGAKTQNFSMNLSQKSGGSSQKTGPASRKTGVLSQRDTWDSVCQELSKLPLALFESPLFQRKAA